MKKISDEEIILNELTDNNDWINLACDYDLSENMIEMFGDKISWDIISEYQNIPCYSNNFVKIHEKEIYWPYICYNDYATEDFIEKYITKFDDNDWRTISSMMDLSEEFIERHADKVNWIKIGKNQKLSEEFIDKYFEKLDFAFLSNLTLPKELKDKLANKYRKEINETNFKDSLWKASRGISIYYE